MHQLMRYFPIVKNGKSPLHTGWQDELTNDVAIIKQWRDEGYNIACAMGNGLIGIDLDEKDEKHAIDALAQLEQRIEKLPYTYTTCTPTGGRHLYFSVPSDASIKNSVSRIAEGIDIRSNGGYLLSPGSTINGIEYTEYLAIPIAELPATWVDHLKAREYEPATIMAGNIHPSYAQKAMESELNILGSACNGTRNDTLNTAAFNLGQFVGAGALDESFVKNELTVIAERIGLKHNEALKTIDSGMQAGMMEPRVVQPQQTQKKALPEPPMWLDELDMPVEYYEENSLCSARKEITHTKNKNGDIIMHKSAGNLTILLDSDRDFSKCLGFDELRGRIVWLDALPNCPGVWSRIKRFEDWQDSDATAVQHYATSTYKVQFPIEQVRAAVENVAKSRPFNLIKQYFSSLKWDGIPRIDRWLSSYMGAKDNPYTRGIGRKWLLAMAARAMQPGCKCDFTLVLQGPQGCGKSSALQIIGAEWYTDSIPPDVTNKDAIIQLRGKLLVEFAELSAMRKSDTESLKAFLTRTHDEARESYARTASTYPRCCVFAATTNDAKPFQDDTGNRRFWPVNVAEVSQIDLHRIAADRTQLLAEAVSIFMTGEVWWPDNALSKLAVEEQETRIEQDPWHAPIAEWCEQNKNALRMHKTHEIAYQALQLESAHMTKRESRRIGKIMRDLEWNEDRDKLSRGWRTPFYLPNM